MPPITRQTESRAATERPTFFDDGESRFTLDLSRKPNTHTYQWVRETIFGQPDEDNISQALEQGWTPVPASRHPEKMTPTFPGREVKDPEIIRRGGQILFERLNEREALYRRRLREKTQSQEAAARRHVFHDPGRGFVAVPDDENSTVIERRRGKEFAPETTRFE